AEDTRTAPNADAWSADSAASAKRLQCVRFIGAFRPARDGQRFIAAMPISGSSRLSLNRTNSKSTRPSKAAEHRRTARRWRVGYGASKIRQVLECATAGALDFPTRFMLPMRAEKRKEALSEDRFLPVPMNRACAPPAPNRYGTAAPPCQAHVQRRGWIRTDSGNETRFPLNAA